MLGEDAIAAEHRIGFRAGLGAMVQKRPRGAELALEETEPLSLRPIVPRLGGKAGRPEELCERLGVEDGVLADIELREVEAEDFHAAPYGGDIRLRETGGAFLVERGGEEIEIGEQLGRKTIAGLGGVEAGYAIEALAEREARQQKLDVVPPGLVRAARLGRRFAEQGLQPGDRLEQARGGGLHPGGKRELFRQAGELALGDLQGVERAIR